MKITLGELKANGRRESITIYCDGQELGCLHRVSPDPWMIANLVGRCHYKFFQNPEEAKAFVEGYCTAFNHMPQASMFGVVES